MPLGKGYRTLKKRVKGSKKRLKNLFTTPYKSKKRK